jgi:hypothetical protein
VPTLLAATLSLHLAPAAAQVKRSGSVIAVDVESRTLTLEELGVAGQPVRHVVAVPPSVRVVDVERRPDRDIEGPGAWPGGFLESPASTLAPGDFVTITFAGNHPGAVARTIEIVRPEADPAASPASAVELPRR